ncbi:MAG: hypothetical protein LQ337_004893 [Flavoplaca oasis]|nr:MAG: hypothetical protein LQ337_004893 [Flavoplaca oasis]
MLPLYLCIFLLADVMFAATGGLLIAVVLISKRDMVAPTTETVAPNLLLAHAPLNSALFDAGLIFFTFLVSIFGLIFTTKRAWLKVHCWMVLGCIIVTLVIGLQIWFSTLKTRANLAVMWDAESPQMQDLLQERTDSTCPSPLVASEKPDCVGPFSEFANGFLDQVFSAMFGMVVLKKREEEERYRHIDEKSNYTRI